VGFEDRILKAEKARFESGIKLDLKVRKGGKRRDLKAE
jgi:hypothetical protein